MFTAFRPKPECLKLGHFYNRFFVTKKSVFCIENISSWKIQFRLFWKYNVYLACERLKYTIQGEIPAQ